MATTIINDSELWFNHALPIDLLEQMEYRDRFERLWNREMEEEFKNDSGGNNTIVDSSRTSNLYVKKTKVS